jgi:hypothetical protein
MRGPALAMVLSSCSASIAPPGAAARRQAPDLVPAPGRYLHKRALGDDRFQTAEGLVTPAGRRETRTAYYAAQMAGIRCAGRCDDGYPQDLRSWKLTFGFAARQADETLSAWRARTHVAVYYNVNELGLGREMACAAFTTAAHGLDGQACWVTNYGQNFNDEANAIRDAEDGVRAKNTVCIVWNPELPAGQQVNFWTFAGADASDDGVVAFSAQLDYMGARAVPQICTGCHGGHYEAAQHLVRDGRFLPPNILELRGSIAAQMETFRLLAETALGTPLTPAQAEFIVGTFGGRVHVAGQQARRWVPAPYRTGFPSSDGTIHDGAELYGMVLAPHCMGCHDALQGQPDGRPDLADPRAVIDDPALVADLCDGRGGGAGDWARARPAFAAGCASCHDWHENRAAVDAAAAKIHARVASGIMPRPPAVLAAEDRAAILAYTSGRGGGYTMPNAQPTQRRFWSWPVIDGHGVRHASAKVYLLGTWLAGVRAGCSVHGCDCPALGCDVDAQCGDADSGTRCDVATGRCVDEAVREGGACAPEIGRLCPAHEECADGSCLKCGRIAEPPCPRAGCEPGLEVGANACRAQSQGVLP